MKSANQNQSINRSTSTQLNKGYFHSIRESMMSGGWPITAKIFPEVSKGMAEFISGLSDLDIEKCGYGMPYVVHLKA